MNLFFEKGFDNVYLLTGGIEKLAVKYPEHIEGTMPVDVLKQIKRKNTASEE